MNQTIGTIYTNNYNKAIKCLNSIKSIKSIPPMYICTIIKDDGLCRYRRLKLKTLNNGIQYLYVSPAVNDAVMCTQTDFIEGYKVTKFNYIKERLPIVYKKFICKLPYPNCYKYNDFNNHILNGTLNNNEDEFLTITI